MITAERPPRWIVTGGAGFIGSRVAAVARSQGVEVLTVDRAMTSGQYAVVDLTEPSFRAIVAAASPAVIVHAAGPASVRGSISNPERDFRNAVLPWLSVLEVARGLPLVPKVVFISSGAVYGSPSRLPVAETDRLAPISPYGYHKLICEQLADEYATMFGVPCLVLRAFSVYGSAQRRLILWELFQQVVGPNPEVRLLGTGEETRDYLHVDDLAEALVGVARLEWGGRRVLNIASGIRVSTRRLAEAILAHLGSTKPLKVSPSTPQGDPPHWQADVSELRSLTTAVPRSFEDGLRACIQTWLRDQAPRAHDAGPQQAPRKV